MTATLKLTLLRQQLVKNGINAYLVPQTDVHQNEYLPNCYKRLEWLTDFSGSAGMSVITETSAAVFVDGRYTLQATREVDTSCTEIMNLSFDEIQSYLARTLKSGDVLGLDPWLVTHHEFQRYVEACKKLDVTLKPISENLVDLIWDQRPNMPDKKLQIHDIQYAGQTSAQKLQDISQNLRNINVDMAVITQCDSVAWLLNVRGADIACTPVALTFAIAHCDQTVDLFVNTNKIDASVQQYLGQSVRIYDYNQFAARLNELAGAHKTIAVDLSRSPYEVTHIIASAGGKFIHELDVCLMPRACKNSVEINGTRQAHIKDGVAMVHLFAWLNDCIDSTPITELDVVAKLRYYRDEQGIVDISFHTITGSGPNGAIVHYRANTETNRQLLKDELFLLDSGGQYLEGTTDITRTICMGHSSIEQQDRYTRVLKGHIQLAGVKFPYGTSGHQLDVIARYHLWQAGIDYAHGTGHGVGSYLSVHEGPQRISTAVNSIALRPGMIISNEPGYYKRDAFGIRIENLIVVTPCPKEPNDEHDMLCFETITLAPIDKSLIMVDMLTHQERQWLNSYHAKVRKILRPYLHSFAYAWFDAATEAL